MLFLMLYCFTVPTVNKML